ncbi:MAG: 3-phosphoserine/phosphohydroxythreonine transaminase [Gammaproteobacteria bacterium]|nr:3-phosphoserine/phosphohydroxythreonine transaminase [Gammaproteobacteria bacterium]
MSRPINFGAGPAMLPESVLSIAQAELFNWQNTGMSVMEVSHRSKQFMQLRDETEELIRQLMQIPSDYHVLFLAGGARTQFAMVPMNLLAQNSHADYLITGAWSQSAYDEATRYGKLSVVARVTAEKLLSVPDQAQWQLNPKARYFYYTPNETLLGVELANTPKIAVPIVADMTSCILSRDYDVKKFGVIFASAQKNLGQAGVTVVIVHKDLLSEPFSYTPSMFDYRIQVKNQSLYNTSPTYAIYIMNLMLKWTQQQGGVPSMMENNAQKAHLLYNYIDTHHFYNNAVAPEYRSQMNVSFNLPTRELEAEFVVAAAQADLLGLKGHSSVGGIRASLYNAMTLAGVEALVRFMEQFRKQHA